MASRQPEVPGKLNSSWLCFSLQGLSYTETILSELYINGNFLPPRDYSDLIDCHHFKYYLMGGTGGVGL
jgi:hypothetical protein